MRDKNFRQWHAGRQFTGRRDERGIEIYEGDVVEALFHNQEGGFSWNAEVMGVVYVDGQFGASLHCEKPIAETIEHWRRAASEGKSERPDCWSVFMRFPEDFRHVRVIGNIFEPPRSTKQPF